MDPRKILILKGSPREKGNTSILADQVAEGARNAGAQTESILLHNVNINPCDHCDFCQGLGDGSCVVEDDMQDLYPKLIAARGIIIASPIYWFTISAQTKLCIDRWYALEGPDGSLLSGKKIGIVLAYGDTDPYTSGAINAIRTFQDMIRYIKAELVGMVYGSATDAGEIRNNQELLKDAFRLGEKIGRG